MKPKAKRTLQSLRINILRYAWYEHREFYNKIIFNINLTPKLIKYFVQVELLLE